MTVKIPNLPKWPQMIVTGKSVTKEQAWDIILKTDDFLTASNEYAGGNYDQFTKAYQQDTKLNHLDWNATKELRKSIGFVDSAFVYNRWASSSFVYGPAGWCKPNGEIQFCHNVGKWPEVEEILNDWSLIASAFEYLDLNVTIMSGESCEEESTPLINIKVSNGVAVLEEANSNVHPEFDMTKYYVFDFSNSRRELGLPDEFYNWAIPIIVKEVENLE